MYEPESEAEWREAATLAEVLLDIDAARKYGLISGGPPVDEFRCLAVIAGARARGIVTRAEDVNGVTDQLIRELGAAPPAKRRAARRPPRKGITRSNTPAIKATRKPGRRR